MNLQLKFRLKTFVPFLTLVLVLLVAGCSSSGNNESGESTANDKPIEIKFGHTLTEDSSWQKGAEKFAELIEEKTDGRYKVNIFPNGQISSGDQKKAIEMLRQGNYDVDITSTLIWSDFDDEIGITALPWIVPNEEAVRNVSEGKAGELILDIVNNNGVKAVGIGETGYRQMYNNEHQIRKPEDLKNLKMRVPGTPLFLDLFKELGSDPTAMDFTEVFTGLQQGTIDGVEGVPDVMVTNRFHEVLKYMSLNNYNFDFFLLTFSNDFYDSLSEEDQEIFMDAGKEATQFITEYSRDVDAEAVETLKQELDDVVELSDDEIDAFRNEIAPIYDKFKDNFSEELREAFNYPE